MSTTGKAAKNIYQCDDCGYRYQPSKHDGIDLDDQEDWECPDCQAGRDHFHIVIPPSGDLAEKDDDPDDEAEPELSPHVRAVYRDKSDPTVSSLKKKYDRGRLDPQPDFQRYEVWSNKKNSRLIESILLDLPLPLFYFAQQEKGPTVVIDGQQRLMAIFNYLDGEYALTGLGPLKVLEGNKFNKLDDDLQERIEDFKLSVVEILRESEESIKFDLFERLNTGAVSLNEQELRNSVYRGDYNDLLKKLATNTTFRKFLKLNKAHPRMNDVEFVLRYMAFRDQTYLKHDDKKTGEFLNRTMRRGKQLADNDPAAAKKEHKKAEADFKKALANTLTVFGADKAFRRFTAGDASDHKGGWEKRINKALMDVQLYAFTHYDRGVITKNRDAIYDMAVDLMAEDTEFSDLVRHTISEKKRVIRRFRLWEDALGGLLAEEDLGPRLFARGLKEKLFKKSAKCQICGQQIADIDDAHLDHRIAFTKGGKTVDENAALTHRWCNLNKGAQRAAG